MGSAEGRVLVDVRATHEAGALNTNGERSSATIESVDDLAELLLRDASLRRKLIESEQLSGLMPNDDISVVVERLLALRRTEVTVRKILDAPNGEDVVRALSQFAWQGQERAYTLVEPNDDPGSLREAVLCLTTLVTAHLEHGPKGVDSVAKSTPLLKASKDHAPSTNDVADPKAVALVELVSNSGPGDPLVVLGDDFLTMTKQAFKVLWVNWDSWLQLLGDGDYVEKAVRLTPGLPSGAEDIIIAQLRRKTSIRAVSERDAPPLREVVRILSQMEEEKAKCAAARVFEVFFRSRYDNLERFLMACLEEVVGRTEGA